MQVEGTVVWLDFEGGFWGIEGDDERKYCPEDLPESVATKGKRVRMSYERSERMSTRMWGIEVDITRIEAI